MQQFLSSFNFRQIPQKSKIKMSILGDKFFIFGIHGFVTFFIVFTLLHNLLSLPLLRICFGVIITAAFLLWWFLFTFLISRWWFIFCWMFLNNFRTKALLMFNGVWITSISLIDLFLLLQKVWIHAAITREPWLLTLDIWSVTTTSYSSIALGHPASLCGTTLSDLTFSWRFTWTRLTFCIFWFLGFAATFLLIFESVCTTLLWIRFIVVFWATLFFLWLCGCWSSLFSRATYWSPLRWCWRNPLGTSNTSLFPIQDSLWVLADLGICRFSKGSGGLLF